MANISGFSIYSVAPSDKANRVDMSQAAGPLPIRVSYDNLVATSIDDQPYLLGYNRTDKQLDAYEFQGSSPWLNKVPAKLMAGTNFDAIVPFQLGNAAYLACYKAKAGIFTVFGINSDLSLSSPFQYYRNHEPAVTKGFTALKSFLSAGNVTFLGYNTTSGYVAMYALGMMATSPKTTIPIQMTPQWSHIWAPGWTRFAFFTFGGGNYFLKTNIIKPNVNIDHVLDTLSDGTVEVGTYLNLSNAQQLAIVEPFTLGFNDPFFVAYKPDGSTTVYKVRSDCVGWIEAGSATFPPKMSHIVPIALDGKQFLVCR